MNNDGSLVWDEDLKMYKRSKVFSEMPMATPDGKINYIKPVFGKTITQHMTEEAIKLDMRKLKEINFFD